MLQKNSPHPSPLPNWGEGNVAPELAWGVIAEIGRASCRERV